MPRTTAKQRRVSAKPNGAKVEQPSDVPVTPKKSSCTTAKIDRWCVNQTLGGTFICAPVHENIDVSRVREIKGGAGGLDLRS
eukprot:1188846-Prorocentrum_minimum.AAC.2